MNAISPHTLLNMSGITGWLSRTLWMWLPPIMGTRKLVTMTTALLLIPLIGWGMAQGVTAFAIVAFIFLGALDRDLPPDENPVRGPPRPCADETGG